MLVRINSVCATSQKNRSNACMIKDSEHSGAFAFGKKQMQSESNLSLIVDYLHLLNHTRYAR